MFLNVYVGVYGQFLGCEAPTRETAALMAQAVERGPSSIKRIGLLHVQRKAVRHG